MSFKKVNNITGWVVCLIACSVYVLTAEAGGSLWDCGEFVSSCFKVQIPHPPGAPLFVLIGRIFIVLFGNNPLTAAKAVNVMSALASGFTILFLFWTITHFARRIIQPVRNVELTMPQVWAAMGAGVVGALAYTFSDSFWYSAVEGEVYALSSFFTAIVFWAILKWEHTADEPGADRWIVFIFFLMGLSIGVHLLNLLTIPAIVLVYYFRRREDFNYKLLRKYFVWCLAIGGGLGFIASLVMASGEVNAERGVTMDGTVSGLILVGTVLAIVLLNVVESFNKSKKEYAGGAYIFLVIACVLTGIVQVGVIQYSIKAAGAFDIFFVNSLKMPFFSGFIFFFALLAFGIWFGLRFSARKNWPYLRLSLWSLAFMLIGYSTYVTTMIRSSADPSVDMYNVDNPMSLVGYLGREQYGDFPLLYGQKFTAQPIDYKETTTKYQKGKDSYIPSGKNGHYVYAAEDKMVFPRMWDASNDQGHADYYAIFMNIGKNKDGSYERAPNFGDNLSFFVAYQNYFMYFRYFMWNFSGKQNDVQGEFIHQPRDGNWITGISFIDNLLYGDQSTLPDSLKNNKAHNTLFALPFILGLIGLFYHFRKRKDDALVSFLLFFFTGLAIVLYLNQAGRQPRERDYAYVGSFYAFAIWIGLGVLQVKDWFGKKLNPTIATAIATGLCLLAVPVLMAQQEWDDHDRSRKVIARDLAKDYLESCDKNAILFTFGDNDTYPLWYAQEVEGIRPDIRVINTSLLGIDWYINQMRYKVNQSPVIDLTLSAAQIEGRKRDYIRYQPKPQFPESQYYYLSDVMKYVASDDPDKVMNQGDGEFINTFPVRRVSIPVDANAVKANGTVNATDSVVTEVKFEIPKNIIMKNDLAVLDVIAANQWKRPIYFTQNYTELGFGNYLRKDGLSYRLVPVAGEFFNTNKMFENIMNKFAYGNADLRGVYYDEENRRHLNTIRRAHTEIALDLSFKNRKEDARKALEKADKMMLQENFPYGMVSRGNEHNRLSLLFLQACYQAGDTTLAAKVSKSVKIDLQQQVKFYNSLTGYKADMMSYDKSSAERLLQDLTEMEKTFSKLPGASLEGGAVTGGDTIQ
ncbi:glycosyltransferase family 117 protein [Foetidibacter luteolus]|uniref:glycosyltransferase family 117 protein n=1 Tax=Foetidibacter luteolus TaxID=2608880 RepID=UPI001F4278A6|nr:DUF2723 domain-containing protein [Foetidibacter luteolus]